MNDKEAIKLVGEIEIRLTLLKSALGAENAQAAPKPRKAKTKTKGVGSSGPVRKLVDGGFFNTQKSAPQVKAELAKKALKFDKNDLAVTLMRLVRSEALERVGGDGTREHPWLYKKV